MPANMLVVMMNEPITFLLAKKEASQGASRARKTIGAEVSNPNSSPEIPIYSNHTGQNGMDTPSSAKITP